MAPINKIKWGNCFLSPPILLTLGNVPPLVRSPLHDGQFPHFIANLAKGRIGEDKASLLGALLISQFQQAALSRAELAPTERRDFFLFVDEFQSYSTDSFSAILAEARKYKMAVTLSNQHLGHCGSMCETPSLAIAARSFLSG